MGNELIADYEKEFLYDILNVLDNKIEEIENKIDPDSREESIYFDHIEYLRGVGLVTCQRYLESICNLFEVDKKNQGVKQGPKKDQVFIAEIVNSVANYWKHIEDKNGLHVNTKEILKALDIEIEKSYCVTNVLYRCGYKRLSDLFNDLVEWRNSFIKW